jgi:hypothetical protein
MNIHSATAGTGPDVDYLSNSSLIALYDDSLGELYGRPDRKEQPVARMLQQRDRRWRFATLLIGGTWMYHGMVGRPFNAASLGKG